MKLTHYRGMESWNASSSEATDIHRGTFVASGGVNIA
jgi:hypothetical protein